MKTYLKTLIQAFTKHVARFLSIIFMVLLSTGFITGLGSCVNKIDDSLTDFYVAQNVSDFIVKSTDGAFSDDEISAFETHFAGAKIQKGASFDVEITLNDEKQLVRLYFLEEGASEINMQKSVEKSDFSPEKPHFAKVEQGNNNLKDVALDTQFTLNFKDVITQLAEQNGEEAPAMLKFLPDAMASVTFTVNERVNSPLLFALDSEPSYTNPKDTKIPDNIADVKKLILLDNVFYLSQEDIPSFLRSELAGTDAYISIADRALFSAYSSDYKAYIESEKEYIKENFPQTEVLTLYDNYSFYSLHSYAEKVMGITIVLMIAFMLVTVLVVLSTMTRLLDEERAQIATLRTLGYSGFKIIFKYLLFAAVAAGIGGVGGYFVGYGVMRLLYFVFNYSFRMPPMASTFTIVFFLITFLTIALSALFATALSGTRMMREMPANLLRPKAPKAGKKVFLERIPFLWRPLSFRYKSTARNVLRYLGRFFMTVVAVAFSMALMMAGLSVLDLCLFHDFNDVSLLAVSIIVLVFAGLLAAVVIYTLTNINISERNRELATLKVLGYHDGEVAGYIYREIYIDTAIGILFGYPLAALLIFAVFKVIGGLGTLGGVSWFMWLISPLLVLLFTAGVTLLLRRKIVKIDMNESLKANE